MLKLCRFWTFVETDFSDFRREKPGQISEYEAGKQTPKTEAGTENLGPEKERSD